MEGHVLRGDGEDYVPQPGQEIPDEHKEVSAVMLKFRNPQIGFMMDATINKQGKVATLAWPIGAVMAGLFNKIGWMNQILALVSYLVIVVAGGFDSGKYLQLDQRAAARVCHFAVARRAPQNSVCRNCVGSCLHCRSGRHHGIHRLRRNLHGGLGDCSCTNRHRTGPVKVSSCIRNRTGLCYTLRRSRRRCPCRQSVPDGCCDQFNTY